MSTLITFRPARACARLLAYAAVGLLLACAGPNPNPGERTTDLAWTRGDFQRAFQLAQAPAEAGEPWAQLRLAIFYENGWGTAQDLAKAEAWYRRAASQKDSGEWAEGKLVGNSGKPGYFNQNNDARIAQFNLAQLYFQSGRNLEEAKALVESVIAETSGKSVFFCCEFSGGRYFSQAQFVELKNKIENKMSIR